MVDKGKDEATPSSSIFGGARPVDTATKEKEIEQKLMGEQTATTKEGHAKQNGTSEGDSLPNRSSLSRDLKDRQVQNTEKDSSAEPSEDANPNDDKILKKEPDGETTERQKTAKQYEEPKTPVCCSIALNFLITSISTAVP